ncbi:class C sortase [Lacticaseibacillus daqingensis]|uniref:class C sortase n=1 Tax=Lacticaseibacillus daqingensis TaxID=2486014 RepID=UPI000F79C765|nr:class C sortase [Lacticaseibacillus daqingensis]
MAKKQKKPLGIIDLVIMLLIIAGLGVLAYPFVSDAYVSYKNQQVIDSYQVRETKKNQTALKKEYQSYQAKNKALAAADTAPGVNSFNAAVNAQGTAKTDAKRDQKKLAGDTVAQLTIPKIGVSLPVFDHTSDWLLQFGACLLDGTSYPTGGKSTHAVISGHRGVPNAELFTRLPELKTGNKFFIKIGNKTLAYQVFRREVIEPSDVSKLTIEPGQDLVTLMTCTPYMINSQRLLITGRRVPYTKADAQASERATLWNKLKLYVWALAILVLLVLMAWLIRGLIIGRTRYALIVPTGATQVVVSRGRRTRTFTPDETGVFHVELPGNRYKVVITAPAGTTRYKAFIKRLRDKQFTLKARA